MLPLLHQSRRVPRRVDGYIAVAAVLLISVVSIAIAVTVTQLSVGEGQSGLALSRGEQTLHTVEGCLEDALMRVQANAGYVGTKTITTPDGTCTVVISNIGPTYTLTATNTSTPQYVRSVQVILNRASQITITSWKES